MPCAWRSSLAICVADIARGAVTTVPELYERLSMVLVATSLVGDIMTSFCWAAADKGQKEVSIWHWGEGIVIDSIQSYVFFALTKSACIL